MWRDIRRICENPTAGDRAWFPDIAGSPWRETFEFAMRNFKDESFIARNVNCTRFNRNLSRSKLNCRVGHKEGQISSAI